MVDAAEMRSLTTPLAVSGAAAASTSSSSRDSARAPGSSTFATTVDELLLARARRGDEGALEKLYRTFERPVFSLARRICSTPQDAEEVLQETFLEVVRSLRRFRGEGSFAGWVRRIATTKALMRLRHLRARGAGQEVDEEAAEEGAISRGRGEAPELAATHARLDLESALDRLTDSARAVIWLHEVEGYSHHEIGEMLGKTASFSKSQLARGYARLRTYLAAPGEEAPCT